MSFEKERAFLKFHYPKDENNNRLNPLGSSDQNKGIEMPEKEKAFREEDLIFLPNPKDLKLVKNDVFAIINERQSRRQFTDESIELSELSFILWAMQGLRLDNNTTGLQRTVPSAGARNPFDTYFYASKVKDLPVGLYRYVWSKHAVVAVTLSQEQINGLAQNWNKGALSVFMVVVPYRAEWRYVEYAHKFCALDAGHIGQNGYLAAEALNLACYSIGGYSQEDTDALLGIDGDNEFTCYIETFGKYESK
jgi:SagB-type dehydrogenase domain